MAVLIFANGVIEDVDWIRPYLSPSNFIIAADGGSRHLLALNRLPDVVIGDMDSLSAAVREWLMKTVVKQTVQFIAHPPAKDETDLELALLYAVENFADEILLFGALGGRLDQTLANVLLLAHPALVKQPIFLVTETERAWLATDETKIQGKVGDIVSLIPLGGDALVGETSGLQWLLRNERLAFGLARGVSNVMTSEIATVTVEDGRLLCIHTRKMQDARRET